MSGPQSMPVAAPSTDSVPRDPTAPASSMAHDDSSWQHLVDSDSDARLIVPISTSATPVSTSASGPLVALHQHRIWC
jgi:hypothetical protein